MSDFLRKLGRDESGATAVEYGLILALIFLAMVGAVQTFGNETISMWTRVGDRVSEVTSQQ
ncbi:MAG: Flp family type IVb pilin [Sphingomonadales bacterium]|nr:Flp family type IVb pilin [Sphingomonadales bacterium]MBD3774104.1 Flp family type IVb pilin [Paracoccaceae bacterium]MBD3813918.1 Flp family type IVb pilin [Betaproteobacteria bacterium]